MERYFVVGDDYSETADAMHTYGITEKHKNEPSHVNKIEVYGDQSLRNLVILLLNRHFQKVAAINNEKQ